MKQAWTLALVLALAAPALAQTSPPTTSSGNPNESVTVTGKGPLKPQNELSDSVVDGFFGGLTGQDLVRSIDALDRPMAYEIFVEGLSGPMGEWHDWHGLRGDGRIRATRDFTDGAVACRDITIQVALHEPEERTIMGTACREADGWRFR